MVVCVCARPHSRLARPCPLNPPIIRCDCSSSAALTPWEMRCGVHVCMCVRTCVCLCVCAHVRERVCVCVCGWVFAWHMHRRADARPRMLPTVHTPLTMGGLSPRLAMAHARFDRAWGGACSGPASCRCTAANNAPSQSLLKPLPRGDSLCGGTQGGACSAVAVGENAVACL